jgi:CheY-like chemotaxis protein
LFEQQLNSVVCIEAINGLDAIAKAKVSCPDLIILDLCMPEMNGFEAATVLQKTMPQVPLFMFTNHLSDASGVSGNTRRVFQVHGYRRTRGRSERVVKPLSRTGVTDYLTGTPLHS